MGDVIVLFVNTSDPANVVNEPSVKAVLKSDVEPVMVLPLKAIDLFVTVSEFVVVRKVPDVNVVPSPMAV